MHSAGDEAQTSEYISYMIMMENIVEMKWN